MAHTVNDLIKQFVHAVYTLRQALINDQFGSLDAAKAHQLAEVQQLVTSIFRAAGIPADPITTYPLGSIFGRAYPAVDPIQQFGCAADALRQALINGRLDSIDAVEAQRLVTIILGAVAILEDSISTPSLGSLFDRASNSPMSQMQQGIARTYGADLSFVSTNGTSAVNTAAVASLAGPGEWVLVDRGCHLSVMSGLILSGAKPCYLIPPYDVETGVLLPPHEDEVSKALGANPNARAVVITAPTYNGLAGYTKLIAQYVHRRNIPLMVDEAHGPHLCFLQALGFPHDAVSAGADVVTQSTHKVLSTLNQGSLVHFRHGATAARYEAMQALMQSTSFSYPIAASVEYGVVQMIESGEAMWRQAGEIASELRRDLARLHGVHVLEMADFDNGRVQALDPTRVTINVRNLGLTGWDVERALAARGVIAEMAALDTVLFLLGPCHATAANAILQAMTEIASGIDKAVRRPWPAVSSPPPQVELSPRDAFFARKRVRVPRDEAVGELAAETIGAYPPGQVVIGPGERVTTEAVEYLAMVLDHGGHLKRARDDDFRTIEIVAY